ncbi:MAG: glycoside hydrolase family 31 protein [Chitinophagales bacterium]|nr:glycoside hydrolase family 31 protein [Chitinophagales bacterium]
MKTITALLLFFITSQSIAIAQPVKIFPVKDSNLILPPAWAFGVLYGGYTNQQQTIDRVDAIKAHDYPIDAYWIDSWFWSHADKGIGPHKYIDFIADTVGYPNRKQMWKHLEHQGIKGGFWTWDCILETGNEKAFHDFKTQGFFSSVYINKNSWHNKGTSTAMFQEKAEHPGTACGNIDFDNPAAAAYFKKQMKHFFEEGADFIKLDRTSKISTCKAMFELSQEYGLETKGRGFIFSHTGGMETEEYKRYPAKWTDDTRSDWTIENPLIRFNDWVPAVALKENIAMFTDPGKETSRIPFLANDLGGFDMGFTQKPEEELYIRWLQFSMFNPITEVFCQPENPTANLAWNYSAKADSVFRQYAHLRMQLFPFIYSYAHRSRIEGKPMIGKIPGQLYEYLFGEEILLAPVYEKGVISRDVYLPPGQWINYYTGERHKGNTVLKIPVTLEQIPLFIKAGAILPMRNYASSIEKGNNDTLHLHIYPGADGVFTLREDDGLSNDYLQGGLRSTRISMKQAANKISVNIAPPAGHYKGMNKYRTWILHIHETRKLNTFTSGTKPLLHFYDKKNKVHVFETGKVTVKNGFSATFNF